MYYTSLITKFNINNILKVYWGNDLISMYYASLVTNITIKSTLGRDKMDPTLGRDSRS